MTKRLSILAIDVGRVGTGVAMLSRDGVLSTDLWCFDKFKSHADIYENLHDRLYQATSGIMLMVAEIPTPRSVKSAVLQHGMYAIVQLVAAQRDISFLPYYPGEIQSYARGLTQDVTMATDGLKPSKIPSCKLYRKLYDEPPKDHNVADAVALLALAAHEQDIDVTGAGAIQRAA